MNLHLSDFTGKTIIVTGAAQGIGLATVQAFLLANARRVIAIDLNPQGLGKLAEGNERISPLEGDVADPELVARLGAFLDKERLTLDVLVNNAGIARGKRADETTDEELQAYFDINVIGLFRLSRLAVARMQRSGGGAIVNTASIFAEIGATASSGYSASKAAVAGLTRQMATDYGRDNIRVNAVAPGLIETPLTAERIRSEAWRRQIMIDQCPLRRVGQAEDVARVIRFLASDEAGFISGQVIAVDGGWAMGRYPRPETR
ncbi:SDR family oxidoreductase [Aquamicrobium sp. LC103]|uniref:SDR family NAD(P)-dependent oxidoreductase n=1 Tax=Aquamicrobium sp. LC103 TaxID=1120658 RepID=UPI00063ED28E|nr:SDR family oxidoreductase [Aquamicrobium sp. LC103]TKT78276.1 SDR family oxidoreductase [Aquamicrobium sp. LC103]